MKKLLIITCMLTIILIVSTVSVFASTVHVYFYDAYDKVSKTIRMGGYNYNVYAGWYKFDITGYSNNPWLSYCIDPFAEIYPTNQWDAYVYSPSEVAVDKGKLYSYTGTNRNAGLTYAAEKYSMIGYLYSKYGGSTDKNVRANVNLAFWEITWDYIGTKASLDLSSTGADDKGFKTTSAYGSANDWLKEAYDYGRTGYQTYVYTPTDMDDYQEIIGIPEPGTLLLLGSGLLGFGVIARYRRRKKA